MLIGNFTYLLNDDIPPKICDICQKAEIQFIYENYDICAILCRQAAEFFIKWVFAEEIFFPAPIWYTDSSTFTDLLNSHEFGKAFGDTFLLNEVNKNIRNVGNASIHDPNNEVTGEEAYQSLQTLFRFMTLLYNRIYEIPYTEQFFEPFFTDDNDPPLVRDYDALINEETDPEERAKLALLRKCEDKSFELSPFVEVLPDETGIKQLIIALTDPKTLRKVLAESSIQLRSMISNCYQRYDYREEEAVVAYGIQACRRIVRGSFKYIDQFVKEYTT